MSRDLIPEDPQAEGVGAPYPDDSRQEGTHLLANQAKDELEGAGFTDEQIFEWAAAFSANDPGGTVEDFLDFIRQQEAGRP